MPQPPQFVGSVRVSTQRPLQQVSVSLGQHVSFADRVRGALALARVRVELERADAPWDALAGGRADDGSGRASAVACERIAEVAAALGVLAAGLADLLTSAAGVEQRSQKARTGGPAGFAGEAHRRQGDSQRSRANTFEHVSPGTR